MEFTTRLATPEDRGAVVSMLATAFSADPALRYFFPTEHEYSELAPAFFGYLFDKRVVLGTVWVTPGCEAASLWSPPNERVTEAQQAVAATLFDGFADAVGPAVVDRLHAYDRDVEGSLPDGSFWYLGMLGSSRRGAGAAVMNAGLRHVSAQGGFAILETTNRSNCDYYERHGWRCDATITSAHPSTIWIYRHDGDADAPSGAETDGGPRR